MPYKNFRSFVSGYCKRTNEHKRYMNLHKRSTHKLEQELDILNLIRSRMIFEVSLYGLMSSDQRKFGERLG